MATTTDRGDPRHWPRLSAAIDGISNRRFLLVAAAPLLVIYLLTATWSTPVNKDTLTNALSAWTLGTEGSFYLVEHEEFVDIGGWGWIVPARDSATSQYPPGAALLAAPLYAVWPADADVLAVVDEDGSPVLTDAGEPLSGRVPPIAPATLVAGLTTATAMGLLALVLRRLADRDALALAAAYVGGLATAAWPVASDQLWQHGPGMMWIALGLLLSDAHVLGSGFAYGAAVLTRPPVALVPAAVGLFRGIAARSLRPVAMVGVGAITGLAIFIGYNLFVFGDASLSAGYGSTFQDNVFSGGDGGGIGTSYPMSLLGAAFSPERGLFVYSPFLLVLLAGLRSGWRAAPDWARGAALGGLLYLLLQYKANRYSGGTYFLTYRYPLEALMAAAPVLFLSYSRWVAARPFRQKLFIAAVAISGFLHALAAVEIAIA